jgi:RNA polymerase-binding transcription factor DksA
MAAKKTTSKSAAPKGKAKPAVKPTKPAPSAKKPAAKPVKASAPAKASKPAAKAPVKKTEAKKVESKKAAPTKKPAPAKAPEKKPAPAKAAPAPLKKAVATAPEKKPVVVEKPAAKPAAKPVSMAKSAAPVVKKSSLVDVPPPPPPVKPPFVPPKPAITTQSPEPATNGANGTHSPAFIQKQKQRLLDLRDELVDSMSGMTRDTIRNAPEGSEASGSGQHQGDAGSDAYDRDFALSVLAKEQDALYEIEQALRRIQAGSYGICEISQRKIPQARLEAIPFARLTVECQAQWEKEYGKRRFRPSNEVGFSGGNYVEDEDSETVSLDEDED